MGALDEVSHQLGQLTAAQQQAGLERQSHATKLDELLNRTAGLPTVMQRLDDHSARLDKLEDRHHQARGARRLLVRIGTGLGAFGGVAAWLWAEYPALSAWLKR